MQRFFRTSFLAMALASVLSLVLAACSSSYSPTSTPAPTATTRPVTPTPAAPPTAAPTTPSQPVAAAVVKVVNSTSLGTMLVDSSGRSLYIYTKDEQKKSNCYGGCAQAWPPLLTSGAPSAGDGAVGTLLSTFSRTDGTTQVAYNGWPLYYYAKDQSAGDVTGQNVGGIWFVATADGAPVYKSVSLKVAQNTDLGAFISDASGRSLYIYTKDEPDKSNCTGACAQSWPPLLGTDGPTAGDGVTGSLVGTIKRADGSTQVTYNHIPLYYWARDAKPGDVTGQNVGKVWFVVGPDGKTITTVPSASSTPPAAAAATEIKVDAQDIKFVPNSITVKAGQSVKFTVTNSGTMFHTFTVTLSSADKSKPLVDLALNAGETKSATVTIPTSVTSLYFYCIPHEALGMTGTITVQSQP